MDAEGTTGFARSTRSLIYFSGKRGTWMHASAVA